MSADGPRVADDAGTITDHRGFVVAVVKHRPDQRPCRWICPCTHPADARETTDTGNPGNPPAAQPAVPAPGPAPDPEYQLSLFTSGPQERGEGEAP